MSRGFFWQLASLSSLILSCWAAIRWSPGLASLISNQEPWNRWLAMLIIFVLCSLVVWLVFQAITQWLQRVRLEGFDRQMGALFGLIKGVLFCLIVTFFSLTLSASTRALVMESRSGPWLAKLIPNAVAVLPEEIRAPIGEYLKEFESQLEAAPLAPGAPDDATWWSPAPFEPLGTLARDRLAGDETTGSCAFQGRWSGTSCGLAGRCGCERCCGKT
jgi:membrane protein required for colicin V production